MAVKPLSNLGSIISGVKPFSSTLLSLMVVKPLLITRLCYYGYTAFVKYSALVFKAVKSLSSPRLRYLAIKPLLSPPLVITAISLC